MDRLYNLRLDSRDWASRSSNHLFVYILKKALFHPMFGPEGGGIKARKLLHLVVVRIKRILWVPCLHLSVAWLNANSTFLLKWLKDRSLSPETPRQIHRSNLSMTNYAKTTWHVQSWQMIVVGRLMTFTVLMGRTSHLLLVKTTMGQAARVKIAWIIQLLCPLMNGHALTQGFWPARARNCSFFKPQMGKFALLA